MTRALVYGIAASSTHMANGDRTPLGDLEQRRTSMFSYLESVAQLGQLLGPIFGSLLLDIGVFTPFAVILPFAAVSWLLASIALPNDGVVVTARKSSIGSTLSTHSEHDEAPTTQEAAPNFSMKRYLTTRALDFYHDVSDFARLFTAKGVSRYAFAAFMVTTFGKQSMHIILQYVSKRFDITIARSAWVMSEKAAVVLLLFMVIIPYGDKIPGLRQCTPRDTNVRMAKVSIGLLTVGSFLIGSANAMWLLAPGLAIYALGFGFDTIVRSLITSVVPEDYYSRLYSGIAVAETIGSLFGSIALTAALVEGFDHGGPLFGLPFFVCTIAYLLVAGFTWVIDFESTAD